MSVAVVGQHSLIAGGLRGLPITADWRFVGHNEALTNDAWLLGIDTIVNCALDPRHRQGPYLVENDFDLRLAANLGDRDDLHFVMLSSRLVYGREGDRTCLVETMNLLPDRPYGICKFETEKALKKVLGDRLTVLRLSNIFGAEYAPERNSFFAIAMRSLRDAGQIVFDMSPFVERDFLSLEDAATVIARAAVLRTSGVFNVGAGKSVAVGRIAQWLIEGYGSGSLLISSMREFDPFHMDISAAGHVLGMMPTPVGRIRSQCRMLGERLRDLK